MPGKFVAGVEGVEQPKCGDVERCRERQEISNSPQPNVIPDAFLDGHARCRLRRRLERRGRLHAGIGYHRVRLRQPDRSVSVAPAVDAAQHAGVDLGKRDADIVVLIVAQRGDAARPVAVIGPKP